MQQSLLSFKQDPTGCSQAEQQQVSSITQSRLIGFLGQGCACPPFSPFLWTSDSHPNQVMPSVSLSVSEGCNMVLLTTQCAWIDVIKEMKTKAGCRSTVTDHAGHHSAGSTSFRHLKEFPFFFWQIMSVSYRHSWVRSGLGQ